MKKWFIVIICLLVVGIGGFALFGSNSNAKAQGQTQTRTATVQSGTFNVKVSGPGTVQPVTSEDITSNVDNNSIAAINMAVGQSVTAGAPVVTFTDGGTPIYAPISGVVTSVSVLPGQRVTSGMVVAHISDYNDLQTVLAIDELDIAKIQVGQAVSITANAFPNKTFAGKVTSIANEGTSTNGVSTFNVTVHIDNPSGLKVGMDTEGSIVTVSKANALYVPIDAVHVSNNKKYVLVVTSGTDNQNVQTKRQFVQTGLANEDNVEIIQGLSKGQTVELPALAKSAPVTTTTSGGFGGFGAFGGVGGGMRQNRGSGSQNGGVGQNRSAQTGRGAGASGN